MEAINKSIAGIVILVLLSCQTSGLNRSLSKIEKIEDQKRLFKVTKNDSPEKREYLALEDSLYRSYYDYRKNEIKDILEQKKLKSFVLRESFTRYFTHLIYGVSIITPDSTFTYYPDTNVKYVKSLKEFNLTGDYHYLFRNDSVLVSRKLSYIDFMNVSKGNPIRKIGPTYISEYKRGKLMQLAIDDSVIYKKIGSRMLVDLERKVWDTREGVCSMKGDEIDCGYIKFKNCIKDNRGVVMSCDTLK